MAAAARIKVVMSARLSRRLFRHHLPLGLLSLAAGSLLYVTRPFSDVMTRLAFASAYPALILLCATLLVGPWKLLIAERIPTSYDLRRDIGIWAGITGLFHTGVGQFVHLRGRPWLYYLYDISREKHLLPFRHDVFGFANDTGLLAALILLALLATSNDASLRKLGTPGWKSLQRWNYACFGLTAAHTFAYQTGVGSGRGWFLVTAIASVIVTGGLQLLGWRRRRAATG
jgi:methionine sulfoxide reductase heme-binding subunit